MLYFLAFSGLGTGIAALIFGLFVFLRNRESAISKSYGLLSLSIFIWGISYYFWPLANSKEQAFISFRVLHIGAILIAPSYLWFILSLIELNKKFKKVIVSAYLLSLLFLIVAFTKLFIVDMQPLYMFRYWAVPGIAYHFYLLFWFACVFFAWIFLLKEYLYSSGPRKNQLKYVLIASMLGFLGGATNYLLWYKINVPPVGTFLVGVHIVILAYAIVKFRLMDIRVTITRTGIFVGVYSLVLGLPFILAMEGRSWLTGILGENWWFGPLILIALLATAGPFLYIYLQKRAEEILLREQRKYHEVLKQAARELASIHSLKRLLNLIIHIVTRTVRISHSAMYLLDEDSRQYSLRVSRNIKNRVPGSIDKDGQLVKYFKSQKEPLVYEELCRKAQDSSSHWVEEIKRDMEGLDAEVIVPGFLKDRLMGFLVLGKKLYGGFYTSQDLNTFSVLANQAALAIENASLYESMEEKIRKRTEELVDTQKQLIQAEKLATVGTLAGGVAHEINNPLTAVLTNVQMLLTDMDSLDEDSKESLLLIEEATKRCRTIVQKLMAYAKKPLEKSEFNPVNLLDVVKSVLTFLEFQLRQDNITIKTEAEGSDYLVKGNQNELEQVVTNLILNAKDAIKHIKNGGQIDISLHEDGGWEKIMIKDEGTGIDKGLLTKIFDPFFTTKDVGKGTGLGLSICQSIVTKHKGLISVQSEPGKGSLFTVKFPRAKSNEKSSTLAKSK